MRHHPFGELVGGRRRDGALVTAAESGPRRVTLVDEVHARCVGVVHGADHVRQAPELRVWIGGAGQRHAEGAEIADLERQVLALPGKVLDLTRHPLGHGVEGVRQFADLVAPT